MSGHNVLAHRYVLQNKNRCLFELPYFPSEEEYEDKSWAVLDFIHLDLIAL